MLLQKIIFPDADCEYSEMYYRGKCIDKLSKGNSLSFDTYFNSFSYTKYRDYTNAKEVTFNLHFKGKVHILMCVFNGKENVISEITCEDTASITVPFSSLPEHGFLYPKINAITDCELLECGYYSDCAYDEIYCSIAICTFKREQYVLKNIELLKKSEFSFIKKVFVVDNGKTLDLSLNDDFINILPNKNYGGSGGFTRGMIEAYDRGCTHVIFMDDDVEFYSETLEQMTVFMSILSDRYKKSWFSAGMFPLDKPWQQYELGADWNGKTAIVHKSDLDMRKAENLLTNLENSNIGYGGWWTLCMPLSVVEKGLSYPFFIKFDDVEYGLRRAENTEIITMNAVSIRHEAFDRKTSFILDYYNLRNELVVNTVYEKYGVVGVIRRYWYEVCKQLFLYRYDNVPVVIRAVKDYLKGAEFFYNRDDEKLNTELIQSVPKLIPLDDITEWKEKMRCDEHAKNNKVSFTMAISLGGHLIPSVFLKNEYSAFPLARIGAKDTFMRKNVIQYQLGGNSGLVTKRSFPKFIKYVFKAFCVIPEVMLKYGKCKKSLISNKEKITSMEFWRNRLEIK